MHPEAESKEKDGVWDPMPELTITSPYVHFRIDSNTFIRTTLYQSRLYPLVSDFGFGLNILGQNRSGTSTVSELIQGFDDKKFKISLKKSTSFVKYCNILIHRPP
jgi:hypothetical protein